MIRGAQAATFSRNASDTFEDRALTHLAKCFPKEFAALGEHAARELIRDGIGAAAKYNITSERDVCKYIDLMVVFGREFDLIDWAAAILNDRGLRDPTLRLETLYEEGAAQQKGGSGNGRG